jgi:hypothetical protein
MISWRDTAFESNFPTCEVACEGMLMQYQGPVQSIEIVRMKVSTEASWGCHDASCKDRSPSHSSALKTPLVFVRSVGIEDKKPSFYF